MLVQPLTNKELFQRWKHDHSLSSDWDSRNSIIAEMIEDHSDVIEFGAGRMLLRDLLKPSCTYQPTDIVRRNDDTLVIDLNSRSFEIPRRFSHAVFSGVLEYVWDLPAVTAKLDRCVMSVVASYASTDLVPNYILRKSNGWVSHHSEKFFVESFQRCGFIATNMQIWRDQVIYRFDVRSSALGNSRWNGIQAD